MIAVAKSVALAVAVTFSLELATSQVYIHCVGEFVGAVIRTFVAIPVMEKVGDDIKASEKFAVMVTVSCFLLLGY